MILAVLLINIMVDKSASDHRIKPLVQCKVVMLGDQAVGKSSIINRYINNEFDRAHNVQCK